MDNIINAVVAPVPFGAIEIEGLLLDTGEFAVALQQAASLFSVLPKSAQKWIQDSLSKDFQFFQVKTDRPRQSGKQNRPENALSLIDFERLLRKLDRKGNKTAQDMVDELVGLSLKQLFADAFNQKFEQEERQSYLAARQQGKVTRRSMTDAIKSWCDRHETPEKVTGYSVTCSEALNLYLFGKKSAELKAERQIPIQKSLRDYLTSDELYQVDRIEDRVVELTDLDDIKPTDAIKLVIERQTRIRSNS